MSSAFKAHAFIAILSLCAAPAFAETIGNPLVDGTAPPTPLDTATGGIFADMNGFTQAGTLSSFAFFNNETASAGLNLTPLIFEKVGTDYVLRGVGSFVVNASTGAQTFPFVLTAGSANVGPNFFFGYKNGTDAQSTQTGVVEFSFVASSPSEVFFGGSHANDLNPGLNVGAGTFLGPNIQQTTRVYSLQATSVPEPATLSLAMLGAAAALRRSRR